MLQKLNLKTLSGSDLDQKLKSLVLKEREVLSEILNHIVEVDIRRLYLSYAYPNLFTYLTQHIGYSAGSAQRRIDAARLSREVPEVMAQIENGEINLAQISLLQKSCRQANLQAKQSVESKTKSASVETKKALLSQLAGKSFQESELCVNQILNITPKDSPKTCFQKDKSVRLEVTLSETQWQKFNKAKDLISYSVPSGSLDQVLEYLCDKIIHQKDKTALALGGMQKNSQADTRIDNKKADSSEKTKSSDLQKADRKIDEQSYINASKRPVEKNVSTDKQNIAADKPSDIVSSDNQLNTTRSRQSIPITTRREVFKRDSCCQYVDQRTSQKCGSKWQLTLDHIKPVWAGGGNDSTNLRVLCANHNREIYRSQAGIQQVG